MPPFAVLRHGGSATAARWLAFDKPLAVRSSHRPQEVLQVLREVDDWWRAGHWAVGLMTYEAAPAFDDALGTHPAAAMPVIWWARCAPPTVHLGDPPLPQGPPLPALKWRPALGRAAYGEAIAAIRRHIADGDTYQVNYTFPLEAPFDGSGHDLFWSLHRSQPNAEHSAYLDLGRFVVCSVSPELFFSLEGERLLTRPMKGTAGRGRYVAEDLARAQDLAKSPKDRAENVMIVDMMRNDLGKIARPGSVRVTDLFAVESHPTVHQLTSTIVAESDADLPQLMAALFPCASITGAPKARTMAIIRQLEVAPRQIYTGSLGFLAPAEAGRPRRASFSVAIRTALLDRQRKRTHFGTGGGIVWDSVAESEYEECRTKARVLQAALPDFSLIETLSWSPRHGYRRFADHLRRLLASARFFDFVADETTLRRQLETIPDWPADTSRRVRWLLQRNGTVEVESSRLAKPRRRPWSLVIDDRPVDSGDPFLFHKTTHRRVYDQARERHPQADEVLLWNEQRQITEGLRTNVVLRLDNRWLTPRLSCGLLPGVLRQQLIDRGCVQEAEIGLDSLQRVDRILLINSLRGILEARLPV